jgi:hypothetical protein
MIRPSAGLAASILGYTRARFLFGLFSKLLSEAGNWSFFNRMTKYHQISID